MKKYLINIIFYLLVIVFLLLTIYINKDYSVIINKKIINNEQDLNKYKEYKFVTLNLKNIEETRYSLKDGDKETIIYINNFGKKNVLIELSKSTVITKRIDLMYMEDHKDISTLKNDLSEDKNIFVDGYYTNINLKKNLDIINIKFYITVVLGIFAFTSIIINIIRMMFYKRG